MGSSPFKQAPTSSRPFKGKKLKKSYKDLIIRKVKTESPCSHLRPKNTGNKQRRAPRTRVCAYERWRRVFYALFVVCSYSTSMSPLAPAR